MVRAAVLVSGGGTNLQAIIDAKRAGKIPSAELTLVVASNASAYALTRAENAGTAHAVLRKEKGEAPADYGERLLTLLRENAIDVVVLAGFLTILPENVIRAYDHRILNIHPSLIPSFCGDGFYGLHVHEAALKRGVKVTGATVHFVNEITDGGDIIAQKAVEVLPGDTPEILQRRVMEQAEWILLPQALEQVAGEIAKSGRKSNEEAGIERRAEQ
ncbi:MAG: phosphoribosylglycinamide formyltransferase [Lachnospiraceae bacterium]